MTTDTSTHSRFKIPTKRAAYQLAAQHVIETLSPSVILERLEVAERSLTPAEWKRVEAAVAEVSRRLESLAHPKSSSDD